MTSAQPPKFLERVDPAQGTTHFDDLVGFKIVEATPARAVVELTAEVRHTNRVQYVHGGVHYTMLDHAMGLVLWKNLPPNKAGVTLEIHVHYLKGAHAGDTMRAWAEIVHLGSRIAIFRGAVESPEGKRFAIATGSFALLDVKV